MCTQGLVYFVVIFRWAVACCSWDGKYGREWVALDVSCSHLPFVKELSGSHYLQPPQSSLPPLMTFRVVILTLLLCPLPP